jgi:hypothetical protein
MSVLTGATRRHIPEDGILPTNIIFTFFSVMTQMRLCGDKLHSHNEKLHQGGNGKNAAK